jgi:O-antigen ligase
MNAPEKSTRISILAGNYLVPVMAFFIPVWLPGALLVLIANLLYLAFAKQFKNPFKGHTPLVLLNWCALAYLLVQIAGLWETQDIPNGLFNLQQKISFLLFPVFFASQKPFSKSQVRKILYAFTAGTLVILLYLLLKAFYAWWGNQNTQVFFYMQLAHPLHPAYLSAYLCMTLAIAMASFMQADQSPQFVKPVYKILLIVFLVIMLYLIQSKAGILIAFAELACLLVYASVRTLKMSRLKLRLLVFSLITLLTIFMAAGLKQSRFSALIETLQSGQTEQDPKDSNQLRLRIWQTSLELLKENWLTGTGAGDVKHELKKAFLEKGMFYAASLELNAHNQFLQTSLGGGIIHLILLLLYIIIPAILVAPQLRLLALLAILIISMNMLFESYFESQWGIVFACFFLSFLASPLENIKSAPLGPVQA